MTANPSGISPASSSSRNPWTALGPRLCKCLARKRSRSLGEPSGRILNLEHSDLLGLGRPPGACRVSCEPVIFGAPGKARRSSDPGPSCDKRAASDHSTAISWLAFLAAARFLGLPRLIHLAFAAARAILIRSPRVLGAASPRRWRARSMVLYETLTPTRRSNSSATIRGGRDGSSRRIGAITAARAAAASRLASPTPLALSWRAWSQAARLLSTISPKLKVFACALLVQAWYRNAAQLSKIPQDYIGTVECSELRYIVSVADYATVSQY